MNWGKSRVTGDTPGYADRSMRYPVLYLLHGNNDTAAGWTDVGKASFILDNLIAEKKALPIIIVMPCCHAVPYGGSPSNNTETFERYLIEEVVPQIERKYRVVRGREHRAIVGLSMGGGHALHIGLGQLDLFIGHRKTDELSLRRPVSLRQAEPIREHPDDELTREPVRQDPSHGWNEPSCR
jgi:enterochelin esterase-like enzyme